MFVIRESQSTARPRSARGDRPWPGRRWCTGSSPPGGSGWRRHRPPAVRRSTGSSARRRPAGWSAAAPAPLRPGGCSGWRTVTRGWRRLKVRICLTRSRARSAECWICCDAQPGSIWSSAPALVGHRHVGQDGRQDVVEVVRDAAGQRAQRFELLRFTQRLFGVLALDRRWPPAWPLRRRWPPRSRRASGTVRLYTPKVPSTVPSRLRIGSDQQAARPALLRHLARDGPFRVGGDVVHDHALAAVRRGAARAGHRADLERIDRRVVVGWQAGCGAQHQIGGRCCRAATRCTARGTAPLRCPARWSRAASTAARRRRSASARGRGWRLAPPAACAR